MYFIRCWVPALPLQLTPIPRLLFPSDFICFVFQYIESTQCLPVCVQRELQDHQLESENPLPDHILEENWFLLDQQPAIANSSSVRGQTSWEPSARAGILADLAWCRSWDAATGTDFLCALELVLPWPANTASSQISRVSGSCDLSALWWPLSLERRGRGETQPSFKVERDRVSHSLYADQSWISVITTMHCKVKFLWWRLTDKLIYDNKS